MYLTYQIPPVTNAFSVGQIEIEVLEPGVDPDSVPWGADTKPVQLTIPDGAENTSGVVRAMLVPRLVNRTTGEATGKDLGSISAPSGNQLVMGDITLHFAGDWSGNWIYKEGFFYYNKVLAPGETTPELLAGVTLTDPGKREEYQDITVKLDVLADVLQAQGGAVETEWGMKVENGTVSLQ